MNHQPLWRLATVTFLSVAALYACTNTYIRTAPSLSAEKPLSTWMADSDIERNPEGWMIDFRETPKWEYTHGLMMSAHEKVWRATGEERYFDYMKDFADFMIDDEGTIKTYDQSLYNIDRVNPGKFLIGLHQETGEEKYWLAIEQLRDQMRAHPRTSEGGFWHKKVYPHQMWLDGLYMGSPFLSRYASTYDEPGLYDDIIQQFRLIERHTWNSGQKIFHHGWDESREQRWANKTTGRSPHAWGRAMGWLSMAIVDVLDDLPSDHPERQVMLDIAAKMAEAIETHRDADSGVWWQVVNMGGREGNYLESSSSTMFAYFLLKASERGYIDARYRELGLSAYEAVVEEFVRENEDGTLSITSVCAVAGLGGNPYRDGTYEYYINEPRRADDPKAVGPFIMTSVLYENRDQ
ncbi:glycoside hydrolase family 88/105 protein [Marinimicrobium sp. C2-29]|uniref:glycoside hydrolase family 88/105 protein n=1 Tax=Marinimicrobium sp. C2-29 TaxID=3139825 RepID=UPI003138E38C